MGSQTKLYFQQYPYLTSISFVTSFIIIMCASTKFETLRIQMHSLAWIIEMLPDLLENPEFSARSDPSRAISMEDEEVFQSFYASLILLGMLYLKLENVEK